MPDLFLAVPGLCLVASGPSLGVHGIFLAVPARPWMSLTPRGWPIRPELNNYTLNSTFEERGKLAVNSEKEAKSKK